MRFLLYLSCSLLLISISCGKKSGTTTISNEVLNETLENDSLKTKKDTVSESVVLENDSVIITMKQLPGTDGWTPCPTEIWINNKNTDISRLLVRSNPDSCYGRSIPYRYEKDTYRVYPIDSIPSIFRCVPVPDKTRLIVYGPTCDYGSEATFLIDWVTGKCYVLPSNDGFREFEEGTNNIIVASRFNDIDYDLVIWYEELSTINPLGKIIKKTSNKNQKIEDHLPFIHSEAGLNIPTVKLINHQTLKPRYSDEDFWGNRFDCKYVSWNENIMAELDSLVMSNPKWKKINSHYRYEDIDNDEQELKAFQKIDINPKTKTGIVYKGMYTDKRDVPHF